MRRRKRWACTNRDCDRVFESEGVCPDHPTSRLERLPDVLAAHGDTIRVKHRLRPLGVAMAGRDVHDPYKD